MITSTQNPKLQLVRSLLGRRRDREKEGAFVTDGVRLTEEGINAGFQPSLVLYSNRLQARGMTLIEQARVTGIMVEEVAAPLLDSLSETETTQGIMAVFPIHSLPLPAAINFLVIADNLRDPGNLGTLLRTASAAGAQAVVLTPGTVDAYSPKVVRSAMGAHFHIPIHELDWPQLETLCLSQQLTVTIADIASSTPLWKADFTQPSAVLIGSEADGPSPQSSRLPHQIVTIPMPGYSESLNAAAASAIFLFEVVRQRSQ